MPGDKKKIRPLDAKFINVHEPQEIRYWSQALGVSPEQLISTVNNIGPSVEDVKKILGR